MMLTWKIFVTVLSMVSLTLQMHPSNMSFSSCSSQDDDPGSPWATDPDSQRHYPHAHNKFNPFNPGSNAYNCYAYITMYCGIENNDVTSEDCAQQGIFLYREKEPTLREQFSINSPHVWVYEFFYEFPLAAGQLQLPEEFCAGNGRSCHKALEKYRGDFQTPMRARENFSDPGTENRKRFNIAWFALHNRDLYELDEERIAEKLTSSEEFFEREYLNHISETVSSKDPNHTPFNYCQKKERISVEYKFPAFLADHLQLNRYRN